MPFRCWPTSAAVAVTVVPPRSDVTCRFDAHPVVRSTDSEAVTSSSGHLGGGGARASALPSRGDRPVVLTCHRARTTTPARAITITSTPASAAAAIEAAVYTLRATPVPGDLLVDTIEVPQDETQRGDQRPGRRQGASVAAPVRNAEARGQPATASSTAARRSIPQRGTRPHGSRQDRLEHRYPDGTDQKTPAATSEHQRTRIAPNVVTKVTPR
jgi:hypothetical protein